jgi:hypothetical protein
MNLLLRLLLLLLSHRVDDTGGCVLVLGGHFCQGFLTSWFRSAENEKEKGKRITRSSNHTRKDEIRKEDGCVIPFFIDKEMRIITEGDGFFFRRLKKCVSKSRGHFFFRQVACRGFHSSTRSVSLIDSDPQRVCVVHAPKGSRNGCQTRRPARENNRSKCLSRERGWI